MRFFRTATGPAHDLGLFLLRAVAGGVFIAHGMQKLFTFGIPGTVGAFTQMGAPMPEITAPIVTYLELIGGTCLVLGLLTRVVGVLLACDMLTAILLVHIKNGFFVPMGVEFVMTLGAVALALAIIGPGNYSFDAAIDRKRS